MVKIPHFLPFHILTDSAHIYDMAGCTMNTAQCVQFLSSTIQTSIQPKPLNTLDIEVQKARNLVSMVSDLHPC